MKKRRFFTDSTTFDVAYLLNSPEMPSRHKNGGKHIRREDVEKTLYEE